MEKVKSILLKVELKGRGVVNFDSNEQRFLWNKNTHGTGQEIVNHDNVSFAKKRWYKENDVFTHRLVISSNCLRHNIFSEDILFQSPNIISNKNLLYSMIGSPGSLLRGYMFTERNSSGIKRSSVLNITDAEQTSNALSSIETFARSGEKVKDENESDITYYKKETIGDITYEAKGSIDLMQLQFVSCDEVFDRLAFNPDNFDEYVSAMKSRLSTFNPKLGYFQIKGSVVEIPEYGIQLSKDNVVQLTKELLSRILKVKIRKASAYAEVVKVSYKLVYDGFKDKMSDDNNWLELTEENISEFNFEPENYYVEYDDNDAKSLRLELTRIAEHKKEKNKEKNKGKNKGKNNTED